MSAGADDVRAIALEAGELESHRHRHPGRAHGELATVCSAIARAIGSPSPVPPPRRVRSSSARENRSKILSTDHRGSRPFVRDLEDQLDASRCASTPTGSPSSVTWTAFSITASNAISNRSWSSRIVPGSRTANRHDDRRRPPPALDRREDGIYIDRLHRQEPRVFRGCEQQQPLRQTRKPAQLVDHDLDVLACPGREVGIPSQFRVSAGDRDRGAELVRRVADELTLTFGEPMLVLGEPVGLLDRGLSSARATPWPRTSRPSRGPRSARRDARSRGRP